MGEGRVKGQGGEEKKIRRERRGRRGRDRLGVCVCGGGGRKGWGIDSEGKKNRKQSQIFFFYIMHEQGAQVGGPSRIK